MLGYFNNFARTTVVEGRGPVGGLVFQSQVGSQNFRDHYSTSESGLLRVDAWNPLDEHLTEAGGAAYEFVEVPLTWAGLAGGRRPDGTDARSDLEGAYGALPLPLPQELEDGDTAEMVERLDRVHDFVRQRYWRQGGPAALRAEQDLEAQALGALWRLLTDEERQFLATAEVFWRDHRLVVGMDFGPVVIELAKAVESLVDRLLVQPFKEWTTAMAVSTQSSTRWATCERNFSGRSRCSPARRTGRARARLTTTCTLRESNHSPMENFFQR
jgi:hypothetical protein